MTTILIFTTLEKTFSQKLKERENKLKVMLDLSTESLLDHHLWRHFCENKMHKTKLQWTVHVPGTNGLNSFNQNYISLP